MLRNCLSDLGINGFKIAAAVVTAALIVAGEIVLSNALGTPLLPQNPTKQLESSLSGADLK